MQSTPPPKENSKILSHNVKNTQASLTQVEKQRKLEIVSNLSADIKKIKPSKFFGSNYEEDAEA